MQFLTRPACWNAWAGLAGVVGFVNFTSLAGFTELVCLEIYCIMLLQALHDAMIGLTSLGCLLWLACHHWQSHLLWVQVGLLDSVCAWASAAIALPVFVLFFFWLHPTIATIVEETSSPHTTLCHGLARLFRQASIGIAGSQGGFCKCCKEPWIHASQYPQTLDWALVG